MAVEISQQTQVPTICLVGNPNTGKSVLFGALTGKYVTVSNYPGTTVEIAEGSATLHGRRHRIIDTPGTNSLIPMSEDEQVTRDILLDQPPDVVVQVGDAKNLKRVLQISVQLAEMGLPFILALNMTDEARLRGIEVDTELLGRLLGVPVVSTIAIERVGLDKLIEKLESADVPQPIVQYPEQVQQPAAQIASLLPADMKSRRAAALMILSGDDSLNQWLETQLSPSALEEIEAVRASAEKGSRLPPGQVISRSRIHFVQEIYKQVVTLTQGSEGPIQNFIGRMSMHPVWGLPVLLVVLYAIWQFVGVLGAGTVVDFVENGIFNTYVNPAAVKLFSYVPVPLVQDLFVGEYGIITMALTYAIALVMPIVFFFFIAFGILEDSGYLPRLAVMVNQGFRKMGLNGKAVLPMVLGLGCDTMATLTTRILETPRERTLVTLLLALGVPCSAQLGVILGMLTTFQSLLIWGGVVLGVLVVVGFLASRVLPGEGSDFILEVPPIRFPRISNILYKTLARTEWYLREAVPLFVIGTLILFVLDLLRLLGAIEQAAAPVVTGILGLPPEAARAFIMGFLRRDYGGAGLLTMYQAGTLNDGQILVSLITLTLFVPCIANFLVMGKERGWKTAVAIAAFIVPTAVLVGGMVRYALALFG